MSKTLVHFYRRIEYATKNSARPLGHTVYIARRIYRVMQLIL